MSINKLPEWYYNELQQVGIDFESIEEVQKYDHNIRKSRDLKKEFEYIIKEIGLENWHTILEIGTGTGEFAVEASRMCKKVFAIDVSSTMLEYARKKAQDRGRENIEFFNSGFLTYNHQGESLDAVVTQVVLHHLPDVWKMIAIKRVYAMLRTGGKFCLRDSMLSIKIDDFNEYIENYISSTRERAGEDIARSVVLNIKEEYPTFTWVIEEMLKKTGFRIDKIDYHNGYLASFICTKD